MTVVCANNIFDGLLKDPEFQEEIKDQPSDYSHVWRLFVQSVLETFSEEELTSFLCAKSFAQMRLNVLRHMLSHNWIDRMYECISASFITPVTFQTAVQAAKRNVRDLIDVLEQMLEDFDSWIEGCSDRDFLTHDDPEAGHLSEETIDRWMAGTCSTIGDLLITQPFTLLRSVD